MRHFRLSITHTRLSITLVRLTNLLNYFIVLLLTHSTCFSTDTQYGPHESSSAAAAPMHATHAIIVSHLCRLSVQRTDRKSQNLETNPTNQEHRVCSSKPNALLEQTVSRRRQFSSRVLRNGVEASHCIAIIDGQCCPTPCRGIR